RRTASPVTTAATFALSIARWSCLGQRGSTSRRPPVSPPSSSAGAPITCPRESTQARSAATVASAAPLLVRPSRFPPGRAVASCMPRARLLKLPSPSANVVAPAVLAREVVQPPLEVETEALVGRGERVVELIGAAGADDRRGDDGVLQHPGHGHLH